MNFKKNLSALLAGGMLAGMLPAAGAAASPVVEYETSGQYAELILVGLPTNQRIHSAQLELTMDGLHNVTLWQDGGSGDNSIDRRVTVEKCIPDDTETETRTTVTVYVDAIVSLEEDGTLPLGTLKFANTETTHSFNATGTLTLLDERQNSVTSGAVTVRRQGTGGGDTGGDTDSGSAGGSTNRNPRPDTDGGGTHTVTAPDTGNGTVQVSPPDAEKGDTVTVTAIPNAGYQVSGIRVTTKNGVAVSVNDLGGGVYTFIMPDGAVTVDVQFTPTARTHTFADVPAGEWYAGAVDYVFRYGMMAGTSATAFSPNVATNRAMIVSILYRLEGSPAASGGTFPDIAAGQYYTGAVAWAAENGIVSGGTDGLFHPDDVITREQLAAILYRYAQFKGYNMVPPASLGAFSDADTVSRYAVDAMGWSAAQGLISGTNRGTLEPTGGATRAQAASILMRFCQGLANMP